MRWRGLVTEIGESGYKKKSELSVTEMEKREINIQSGCNTERER